MSEQPSESARQAIVPDTAAGRRFDAVVAELFPEYSRSRLTEWIKAGEVLLDGAQVRPRDPLRGGEVVTLNVVLETQTDAQPEDIPLDVLFEDEHLLVINKPVGLVVHPGAGNHSGTLVNALLFRDPSVAVLPRAGIVHRLDKDTSGVMVVAKTLEAHTALECRLETGRTHQIRVHMAHVRHPIIGDPLYGGALKLPKGASDELVAALRGFKRQALHAETLEFTHPITGELVRNTAPVPEDMLHLMKVLREDSEAFAARERDRW